jgi:hypothetical protein
VSAVAGEQTVLEGLLVMAYNVGRAHGSNPVGPGLEDGRRNVVLQLIRLVAHLDHGSLKQPFKKLLGPA